MMKTDFELLYKFSAIFFSHNLSCIYIYNYNLRFAFQNFFLDYSNASLCMYINFSACPINIKSLAGFQFIIGQLSA